MVYENRALFEMMLIRGEPQVREEIFQRLVKRDYESALDVYRYIHEGRNPTQAVCDTLLEATKLSFRGMINIFARYPCFEEAVDELALFQQFFSSGFLFLLRQKPEQEGV